MQVGKFYVGHLLRVPVYIGWEAFILLFFAYRQYSDLGPAYIILGIICLILVILMHELGHALVAQALKMPGVAITISALGGYCSYQGEPSPGRRIMITAAGPLSNFLLFGISWGLLYVLQGVTWDQIFSRSVPSNDFIFFLQEFCLWSFVLGCLNSFPLFPLDGGQIALSICTKYCARPQTAKHATLVISVIAAAAMFALVVALHQPLQNLVLIIFLLMVAFSSLSS